ncbi:MAG: hypothetical protein ACI4NU_10955 [Christensenellales bacterium]
MFDEPDKIQIGKDDYDQVWEAYAEKYGSVYSLPVEKRKSCIVKDGIVDSNRYSGILFFLKEAYCSTSCENCENINCEAYSNGIWNICNYIVGWSTSNMWHRVAEWTYGIQHTTKETIPRYSAWDDAVMKAALASIAVVNIKKINGKKESNDKDLASYVEENSELLRREIIAARPKIIVCGYTYQYLRRIFQIDVPECDNWYYYVELDGIPEKVLVLDYYHPTKQYPKLLTYYGITNIYQQFLLSKANTMC